MKSGGRAAQDSEGESPVLISDDVSGMEIKRQDREGHRKAFKERVEIVVSTQALARSSGEVFG